MDTDAIFVLFFHSRDDEYKIRLPFFREGLHVGDKCVHIVDKAHRAEQKRRLEARRVDSETAEPLEEFPGTHDIVQYESRLNYVVPNYVGVGVCTYDLAKFGVAIGTDILRTHPMAIVEGLLSENPYYVTPDEFLRELGTAVAHGR